ncbi:2-dehydro-3-deoxyphosphooctonate aldolase [uncultured archaeon]|nr:2-dehydro-3-deoxyphosphooctonate aldolase [uncultured archaeon]
MIIILRNDATKNQINDVLAKIKALRLKHQLSKGVEKTIIGVIGDERIIAGQPFENMPGVDSVIPILKPYKMASREFHPQNSVVKIGDAKFGKAFTVIAGPCAVENEKQVMETARAVKASGAQVLRGGAYKPRTSPYAFQGLGEKGLKILAKARDETGLPFVTEVVDTRHVKTAAQYADALQIGTRNMQNFELLKEVGKTNLPVVLKRGMWATVEEWLMSAEYVMSEGNPNIILCERGIRTFEKATRATLDVSAIPVAKSLSHLPVIVDPSHAGGKRSLVSPLALAGVAAGADGLIVEVHNCPDKALCDGPQALLPSDFAEMMNKAKKIAAIVGHT